MAYQARAPLAAMPQVAIVQKEQTEVPESFEVERRIEEKDRELAEAQIAEEEELESQVQDAERLIHALRMEHVAAKHFDEVSTSRLVGIQDMVGSTLREARVGRNGGHTDLERTTDTRLAEMKARHLENVEERGKATRYTREIGDEICRLYMDVDKARQHRTEKCQSLGEAVSVKLDEVRDAVAAEQRYRLESEETLLQLLGDMGQKMEKEMTIARRERESSAEKLLSTLERILQQMQDPGRSTDTLLQGAEALEGRMQSDVAKIESNVRASISRSQNVLEVRRKSLA